jgi:hypothetical protein
MQNQPPEYQNQPNSGQPPGYGVPPPGYGQPPPNYSQQPPNYGQAPMPQGQPPGYGAPPPGFGQPPHPNYGQQPPLYQPVTAPGPSYDDQMRDARSKQNLGLGIVGGLIGAVLGAVIWAAIAFITGYELGLIAILVGFLTGFGVRQLGKGVDPIFGIVAAVLALLGCVLGGLVASYAIIVKELGGTVANRLFFEIWRESLGPLNLLFAALAVAFGYITALQNAPKKPK